MSRYRSSNPTSNNSVAYGFDHACGYFYQEFVNEQWIESVDAPPALRTGWLAGKSEDSSPLFGQNPYTEGTINHMLWLQGYGAYVYEEPLINKDCTPWTEEPFSGGKLAEMLLNLREQGADIPEGHIQDSALDLPF